MIQRRIDELKMRRALVVSNVAGDIGLANSLAFAIAELEKIRDALLPDVVTTLESARLCFDAVTYGNTITCERAREEIAAIDTILTLVKP